MTDTFDSTFALSVLIPTHGRPTLLGRTLDSLAGCELPEGYAETVVVENGPKAGTEAVVQEAAVSHPHLRLRYMHVERANKSHALNETIDTVPEGLIVFLDDDVRVENNLLASYSQAAEETGFGYFFGGPTTSEFELRPPQWRMRTLPVSVRGWTLQEGEDPFFLGFNWAAWKSELQQAGLFDVNRGPGSPTGSTGQESDMQRRMRALGLKPHYIPDALVWHYIPMDRCSVRWSLKRAYRVGIEKGLNGGNESLGRYRSTNAYRAVATMRGCAKTLMNLFLVRLDRGWQEVDRVFRSFGQAHGVDLYRRNSQK